MTLQYNCSPNPGSQDEAAREQGLGQCLEDLIVRPERQAGGSQRADQCIPV